MFRLAKNCCLVMKPKLKTSSKSVKRMLHIGQTAEVKRIITEEDLKLFMKLSGDDNEVHRIEGGNVPVVHGALLNGLVSGVIGTKLPGTGTLLLEESLRFPNPCFVNEEITVKVTIEEVKRIITCSFSCEVLDEQNKAKTVLQGSAKLLLKKKS